MRRLAVSLDVDHEDWSFFSGLVTRGLIGKRGEGGGMCDSLPQGKPTYPVTGLCGGGGVIRTGDITTTPPHTHTPTHPSTHTHNWCASLCRRHHDEHDQAHGVIVWMSKGRGSCLGGVGGGGAPPQKKGTSRAFKKGADGLCRPTPTPRSAKGERRNGIDCHPDRGPTCPRTMPTETVGHSH